MSRLHIISALLVLAVLGTVAFSLHSDSYDASGAHFFPNTLSDKPQLLPLAANALTALIPQNRFGLTEPVAQFKDRITLKDFGKFITPDTSPVENDKFTGYHTGVDAEFTDTSVEVPVFAIADGTIVMAQWVKGYGGLIVIRHTIGGQKVYALYGHLDETSFPPAGTTTVSRGQKIAVLGDDHSHETDGVRKHIHFAIYTGEKLDVRGYVPDKADLVNWADPLTFF